MPKCKVCREPFKKLSINHKVCKPECAIIWNIQEKERKAAKETREKKVMLRSRRDWLKLAQAAFNAYVRKRDEKEPCISCGRHHSGQYHAGHYMSTGAKPELRFDSANCHKQCAPCNNHLSGNIALYRINLIQKIGQAELDRLEGFTPPKKYTIPELIEIQAHYKAKLKELSK